VLRTLTQISLLCWLGACANVAAAAAGVALLLGFIRVPSSPPPPPSLPPAAAACFPQTWIDKHMCNAKKTLRAHLSSPSFRSGVTICKTEKD
jgi:hypothetical protein